MDTREARDLGRLMVALLDKRDPSEAYARLAPALAKRTPFRRLDVIGGIAETAEAEAVDGFLEEIARNRTEGGWAVIASTLRPSLAVDIPDALDLCRRYAIAGDVWYAADILAERVPGPALVDAFGDALPALEPWRGDSNRWVRKMVGLAVHFRAKRSRGAAGFTPDAARLLAFVEPMSEERDLGAAKGIGWGLKTLGRHYPDLVAEGLIRQRGRPHRAVITRKALTYLPSSPQTRLQGV